MELAMIKPELNSLFNFPVCYHPTTVIFIDDEPAFLEILSAKLADRLSVLCFNEPALALDFAKTQHNYSPFRERCWNNDGNDQPLLNFETIRNEIYNKDRFNEILVNVTDYDMPYINGIEVAKTMEFKSDIPRYAHIFLTGKASNDFKEMVKNRDFIGKDDPDFIEHLLTLIDDKAIILFSNYSHEVALKLSRDPEERTVVLFDGNFSEVLNSYLKDNNICEFYLFDKQGSYIMLDANASPSWLFVRNEIGMENSIRLAKKHGAPQNIIDALESRNFLLSLYEDEDVKKLRKINWDDYLLPAQRFESNDKYFDVIGDLKSETQPVYYYAYSKHFPDHGINKVDLLSYNDFLNASE